MAFRLNGETFEALGISAATLTRNASGDDSLVVNVPRRLSTAAGFGAFEQVTLSGTGTDAGANFVGWLDRAPRRATGGGHGWTYVFNGPMRWLERSVYQEAFRFLAEDEEEALVVGDAGETGLVMIGRTIDPETGEQGHRSLADALNHVLDYAKSDVGGFTYSLPGGLSAEIPWELRQDDQCKAALRAVLKWSPDLVCRWVGTQLQIRRPSEAVKSISAQNLALRDVTLDPRYDLVCARTDVIYLRRVPGDTSESRYVRQVDSHSGGEIAGGRKVRITVYLEEGEPFPESGIAEEFMRWAGKLHLDGRFVLRGLNWSNLPGDRWSPVAALGGLNAHEAVCQSVTRDLFSRTETIGIGVPGALGLLDLIALKRKPRKPDPGEPLAGQAAETGTLNVSMLGLPEGVMGKWSVDDQGGEGPGSVTLPPGEYTVVFHPAYDEAGGALYFADSVAVTVVVDDSVDAEGDYQPVELGSSILHPWRVEVKNLGTAEEPNWEATVGPGNLYKGLGNWATQEITNGAEPFAVVAGDYLWLQGTYAAGNLDTVSLGAGSALPGRIVISEGEDPRQTNWCTRIARIVTGDAGKLTVEQNIFQHLTLLVQCVASMDVEYPHPVS